jgi:prepilin-type processing-associated H-X9-DG protein
VLYADSAVRISEITDGTSNTLAVGERPPYPQGGWGVWYSGVWGAGATGTGAVVLGVTEPCAPPDFLDHPCDGMVFRFGPGTIDNSQDAYHFWSLHPGGANFLFADGAVHFLPYSALPIMEALASRAGHEAVSLPDY